jgi:hypothetical protein
LIFSRDGFSLTLAINICKKYPIQAENIEDALDSELSFYGKVFGIDVPGAIDLKIDNM